MPKPRKPPKTAVAKTPTMGELQAEIRSQGMRSTGSRVAVLSHLHAATSPLSHTQIFEALADRGFDRAFDTGGQVRRDGNHGGQNRRSTP